jgi:hypothetical protein
MENVSRKIGLRVAAGFLVAIIIIVAVFASGIPLPNNQEPAIPLKTGILNVFIVDAPVELNHLNITITDLEVHKIGDEGEEGKWISLVNSSDPEDPVIPEFDLLYYQGSMEFHAISTKIEAGNYTKIRMLISSAIANKTDDPTNPVELKVPSGKIDVIAKFEIVENGRIDVTIDIQPNWVAISNSGNLRPVLKATIDKPTGGS